FSRSQDQFVIHLRGADVLANQFAVYAVGAAGEFSLPYTKHVSDNALIPGPTWLELLLEGRPGAALEDVYFVIEPKNTRVPLKTFKVTSLLDKRVVQQPAPDQTFRIGVPGGTTDTYEVEAVPVPPPSSVQVKTPKSFIQRRKVDVSVLSSEAGSGNL